MQDLKEVVYIDETTFNLWQQPSRSWLTKEMSLNLPTSRGKSLTLIGALSQQRGLFHINIFNGSNKAATFARFLHGLKQKAEQRPLVLVMDNLSVHKARSVQSLYDRDFAPMFLPPYSCTLNPIEHVWSVIKQEWRKTQHFNAFKDFETERERTEDSVARLMTIIGKKVNVFNMIESLSQRSMKNIARSHMKYMARALRGHLV